MRILLAVATLFAAGASTPDVTKLILKPAQVGQGYVLLGRKDGAGMKQVTLDLCGRTGYPSEAKRIGRLQVDYLKQGSKLGLSNEIVVYKQGAAAQAMREVVRHAVTCPSTPINGRPGSAAASLHDHAHQGAEALARLARRARPCARNREGQALRPDLVRGLSAARQRALGDVQLHARRERVGAARFRRACRPAERREPPSGQDPLGPPA